MISVAILVHKLYIIRSIHVTSLTIPLHAPCVCCSFFSHMKQLEYINFSSNSLSTFPPILGSPYLRCLLLHSNLLSSLPAMPTLPHLRTLDLACNQFENVPDISNFPRLEFLDLSGNAKLTISKASIKLLKYVCYCY